MSGWQISKRANFPKTKEAAGLKAVEYSVLFSLFSDSLLGNWSSVLELMHLYSKLKGQSDSYEKEVALTKYVFDYYKRTTVLFAGKAICRNQLVGLN